MGVSNNMFCQYSILNLPKYKDEHIFFNMHDTEKYDM